MRYFQRGEKPSDFKRCWQVPVNILLAVAEVSQRALMAWICIFNPVACARQVISCMMASVSPLKRPVLILACPLNYYRFYLVHEQ